MILYALASRRVKKTFDVFFTRAEAEEAVREILDEETRFVGDVFVAEIELDDPSPN